MDQVDDRYNGSEVAIIGISCRFPGAKNHAEFWNNLRDGVESISFLKDEELNPSILDPVNLKDPNYVKAASMLDDIELFDAAFFGYSPREAEVMDPQHRLFLECAWEALEDAGYDPQSYSGLIGVYAGAKTSMYLFNLFSNREAVSLMGAFEVGLGNDLAFLPTRVSHKLDLKGPSYAVHTACSTSLVAVHLACQSLLIDECQMALAGGIALNVPHRTGYLYRPGGIASPDGHCRVFDDKAQGTVFGSGVGIVVLKRLADALSDGDTIHAVIKGSATNNDGALKASFTAPSVYRQSEVIIDALANADVEPETISYIEAHGTGTAFGDPIEISALTRAFRSKTDKCGFCAIGSVKSNFGHLDAAGGMAGLIKTALALKHRQLPATLHYERPNSQIDFANGPFYVNERLQEWRHSGSRLRAGVNAFGIGGTNAHVILEQAPEPEPEPGGESREYQLIVVSARSRSTLEMASRNLAQYLRKRDGENLADVAYTLQVGRKRMNHRRIIVCRDVPEAVQLLESNEPISMSAAHGDGESLRLVFMFPGQGSQYVNMGRQLYESEEEFRRQVEWCAMALREPLGVDLRQILFPPAGKEKEAEDELNETRITQPALFVIEYAMAKQLERWGIRPGAMIGHSLGEYVAASLAGVMRVEDALWLVSKRGEIMHGVRGGGMVAVTMNEKEAVERIKGRELSIAAVNGPRQVVISGEGEAIEALAAELRKEGKVIKKLNTKRAFHSIMMEQAAARYVKEAKKVRQKPGEIEYISNVTGKKATPEEMTDPGYWGRQMRECVKFGAGIEELTKSPGAILVEVGPGETLSKSARQSAGRGVDQVIISTMRNPTASHHDVEYLTTAIGKLWMEGVNVDWNRYHEGERRRRVGLPTYPFERQRYWIEVRGGVEEGSGRQTRIGRQVGGKREDVDRWFYLPGWQSKELLHGESAEVAARDQRICLVMESSDDSLNRGLVDRLKRERAAVVRVRIGENYRRVADSEYEIRADEKRDYEALLKEAIIDEATAVEVIHLWSVGERGTRRAELEPEKTFREEQQRGYYSLLYLAQAFAKLKFSNQIQICVISDNLHQVGGEEHFSPEKATLLAFCKVIPQEAQNISCRSIDMTLPMPESKEESRLIDRLIMELKTDSPDAVVAYRGTRRWVQSFQSLNFKKSTRPVRQLRINGVYLITGGLGVVGLIVAEYLARTSQARLILTGRSYFPEREEWAQWLAAHQDDDEISIKIRRLQAMEAAGAEITVARIDVADEEQMQALVTRTRLQYGALHGVLHAAGVTNGPSIYKPFTEISTVETELQFQPKAYGLYALKKILQDLEIDFCLLFSSNASVLGGLGLLAYSAANTFMDAFAASSSRFSQAPWISATWDPWPEETKKYAGYQTALDQYLMTPEESVEAFNRVVTSASEGQIVISTGDLRERLDLWVNGNAAKGGTRLTAESRIHPRPEIGSLYVAPRNSIEQTIADIWRELLGLDQVGVEDDFFTLGGHSLLALELIGRLREAFEVELPVGQFFQLPTVAGLAQAVSDLQTEQQDLEKDELLKLLSQFSDDEIKAEIKMRTARLIERDEFKNAAEQ